MNAASAVRVPWTAVIFIRAFLYEHGPDRQARKLSSGPLRIKIGNDSAKRSF
jgi:hypothetical protein